jgi:hypothetical protein
MSDWLIGAIYLFGVLHAVPAWYFGKAAGLRRAREIIYNDWSAVEEYEES